MNHRLKITRVAVSLFCIVTLTSSLVGLLPEKAGMWIARIQFMHLLATAAVGWLALWLILTLLFGRIYCSSVCPLGTLIDILTRLLRPRRKFRYSRAYNVLRYSIASIAVIAVFAGVAGYIAYLFPDTAYSNMAVAILGPAVEWCREAIGHPVIRVASAQTASLAAALVTLAVVAAFARGSGRTFCNTLCPVGALLSLVSRNAVMHIDINTDLCTQCGDCERECKASCIDLRDHVCDMSRCINCFNCIDVCPNDAISYTSRRHRLSTPLMQRISKRLVPQAPQPSLMKFKKNETISPTAPPHPRKRD